jgi:hypothetical protein
MDRIWLFLVIVQGVAQMKKTQGLTTEEINNKWVGNDHEIDRERLLFRLTRIDEQTRDGYFGANNCKLCDNHVPYGSREFGGVEWPVDIQHYIEFHGHRPTDDELQAINFKYEEIKMMQESNVRSGVMRKALEKRVAEAKKASE